MEPCFASTPDENKHGQSARAAQRNMPMPRGDDKTSSAAQRAFRRAAVERAAVELYLPARKFEGSVEFSPQPGRP